MKAFPTETASPPGYRRANYDEGMDLRDYFAAKAMQSILMSGTWGPKTADDLHYDDNYDSVMNRAKCLAEGAYQMADAMMEARNESL